MRLQNGRPMVHDASQIRIRKGDAAERGVAQDFTRSRLSARAKEESRLRTQIGVAPAVQDNAGDVAPGIESSTRKHHRELLADAAFVFSKRRRDEFRAPARDLLSDR